jgi:small-conductance mechanosensitive channel
MSHGRQAIIGGRKWLAVALLAAALAGALPTPALAQAAPEAQSAASEEEPPADAAVVPADLTIANRVIFTMRAGAADVTPAERARRVADGIRTVVSYGGPLRITTRALPEGIAVMVDGRFVFRVLHEDVNPEAGETTDAVAARAVRNLGLALGEVREGQDARALLPAIGYTVLATFALVGSVWLLARVRRWATRRAHQFVASRSAQLAPGWGSHLLGRGGLEGLITLPVNLFCSLLAVLISYLWAGFVLRLFPYTRPWGEALRSNLLQALGDFGESILEAVPGVLFVALIFFLARLVARAVRVFFEGVQSGRIQVGWVDETTARPTGRLVTGIIWLFALVAAYPYIPGSGSEAFKGIGVFVGLMMSIGASGIVNQAVSGLMLMYTKALRPGEFVQIGDTEGTVKSVGFVTTRIETLRHEEVNIPNAVIASSVTRNYSRLAGEGGVWVATKVTIGYDTPWRQVHAMLELAAARTDGVARDPAPRVRQTALRDFYVEYTLLVSIADPALRVVTFDQLHANIQDAFNEHGVQIMSPNYEADPPSPKVVPREKWFEPPASRPRPPGGS